MRLCTALLLCVGCGATPLREVSPSPVGDRLPEVPRGSLWGDGHGPTAREAVIDGRRAVSEQLVAKMSSATESRIAESNGVADRDAHQRVRIESAFDHVELLVTLGVVERDGGFVARVALDRRRAVEVYTDELRAAEEKVRATQPAVGKALTTLDTSVLLVADRAPGHHLHERSRVARVLALLGEPKAFEAPRVALELERDASALRRRAVLRLDTAGRVEPAVLDASVGAVVRQLEARGCQVVGPEHALAPGVPTADAVLRLQTRDHVEAGIKWRYLGLALEITDSRSERPVFRYVALPDFVHAGGPSWAQADKALARRLEERMAKKAAPALKRLTCR